MFENLFEYSKFGYKKIFKIFGIKISFCDRKKYLNRFIPLGCNCYARTIFTTGSVKPRKKYGELSLPFDLVAVNEKNMSKILSNKFNDFFNDLVYKQDDTFAKWSNKKYNLNFNHDNTIITKEEFVERYQKRINNLFEILKSKKNYIIYTIKMFDEPVEAEVLNNIYCSLGEMSQKKKLKYFFFHLVTTKDNNNILNKDVLNKNILYSEIKVSDKFLNDWHLVENFNTDLTLEPFYEIYKLIQETEEKSC